MRSSALYRPFNFKTEMNVITRLMGLILAVVAVGMIGAGLRGMFPILTS
ncbi:hypothetical protein EGI09_11270 [Bacillus subtilis]|nr:hypothetical protein [Bacillus subtilis]